MKKAILPIILIFISIQTFASFGDWFLNKTLRIDYYHAGNSRDESYSIDHLRAEPYWGGSQTFLIDTLNYGEYYFKAFDVQSGQLIYSRGYCSLFDEWQFTDEAKTTTRSFTETVVMPFPKKDVRVEFYSRDNQGIYRKKFDYTVAVNSYFITPERKAVYPVYEALSSGDPALKVDIVILPEGYTAAEMDRFKADCDKFANELFSFDPFTRNRDKFNIHAVMAPSAESGTDIPRDQVWKNTLLNSSFYTFDSERYLMTYDNRSVRDLAGCAPYDQIYILVNSTKYGGGAIYNYYSTSVNSNASAAKIFVHEFGHGFAALADEYDDGSTSFNDMYPAGLEPWEPNITTLVNFGAKWKSMLSPGTPVPTPVEGCSDLQLGVYEGGGYVTKGIYRPTPDCMMRTFRGNRFCPVCSRAIQQMIDLYTR
jgi:hypothetical protein